MIKNRIHIVLTTIDKRIIVTIIITRIITIIDTTIYNSDDNDDMADPDSINESG